LAYQLFLITAEDSPEKRVEKFMAFDKDKNGPKVLPAIFSLSVAGFEP
jgi:hypothetical protein